MGCTGQAFRRSISFFETRLLAVWIVLAAIVWLFGGLASEVLESEADAFDRKILMMFRSAGSVAEPIGPPWLQDAVRDLTALGGVTVLVILVVAVAAVLLLHRMRRQAVVLILTVVLAQLTNDALKEFFGRGRPEFTLHAVRVYSQSFPSGHATMAATTYLTLAVIASSMGTSRRDKIAAFGFAAFLVVTIGISRVYLGVHWPSDVLAGWLAGGAWAMGAHLALAYSAPRDTPGLSDA